MRTRGNPALPLPNAIALPEPAAVERVLIPRHVAVALALIGAAWVAGLIAFTSVPVLADESYHVAQIGLFLGGKWELAENLTTIPGYHVILTGLAIVFGREDITALRVYSASLSIVAILVLLRLAALARDDRWALRVAQIVVLPILFPFLFLVYTDVTALLLVMLAFLLTQERHHWLGALAATSALAIRQSEIVWLVLAGISASVGGLWAPAHTDGVRLPKAELAKRSAGYALGALAFAGFVAWNRGVALGDRAMHPFPGLYLGNVYFALFLSFVLLLPLHVAQARPIARRIRQPSVALAILVLGGIFAATFHVDHPYNQASMSWWLHNTVLAWLASSLWTRAAMFAAIAIAILSLSVTPLQSGAQRLLMPFALLSLVPEWQIEPRYAIMPFALFLLFRVQRSLRFEWLLISYLGVCSGALMVGLVTQRWFV